MPFFVTRPNRQNLTNPFVGLQCKKSDFLNTFSGLTPYFSRQRAKIEENMNSRKT
nr:MAG TPA: hypothetical protein [Caudoviricetes sp.]